MTPLDILSLQDAKDFLKVDFDDDNDLITGLIRSSVSYIEKQTQYRLWNRFELETTSFNTELFQFPINSFTVTDLSGNIPIYRAEQKSIRLNILFPEHLNTFESFASSLPIYYIRMDVGYTSADQVPDDLISAMKKLVTYWYEQRGMNKVDLPDDINNLIDPYKRFVLI